MMCSYNEDLDIVIHRFDPYCQTCRCGEMTVPKPQKKRKGDGKKIASFGTVKGRGQ